MRYKFRHHPSKLSTLMVTFGAGSRVEFETKYPAGIAHFMEHMRFKGTEQYSAKDLLRTTADAGGSWNAWTSEDLVAYHMTIPEENIETAFNCLSEIVLNPIFPEDDMKKEQEVVCQEVRMYDDQIDNLVHGLIMDTVFDNSLISPIVGTEESVTSITRKHLIDFNKEFYTRENMLITLASTKDYSSLVEKYFGIPDDVLVYKPEDTNVKYAEAKDDILTKEGQLQDSISVCFGNEALAKTVKTQRGIHTVFNSIFGSGDTSRLFMAVREDLGLVYGIGAYLNDKMDGTLYEIYTSTEPENREQVLGEIDRQIELMLEWQPGEEEVSRAKNKIRSTIYRRLDSSSGAINEMVNEEFYQCLTGSKFLAEVDSVTAEQVHELTKLIFSGTKYTLIGTGK